PTPVNTQTGPDGISSMPVASPSSLPLRAQRLLLGFRIQTLDIVEGAKARIACRFITQFVLDDQQAVVLCYTLTACWCASLDLSSVGGHDEVGDCRVFGLAGTMGDNGSE